MNCPTCKRKMLKEDSALVVSCNLNELSKYPLGTKLSAGAHYQCEECDSEYSWTLREGLVFLDGSNAVLEKRSE